MPRVAALLLALAAALPAQAAEAPPAMTAYIETELQTWVNGSDVVSAIRVQNGQTMGLTANEILSRDNDWRAQVGQADSPLIEEVLSNPLSDLLRTRVEESGGRITEVFVMDGQGLNVAASSVTSDYWQGDEAKFTKTYGVGPGAVFVDEVELDESTQRYQGQVSFAVSDPVTGEVIGAVTVGLDAASFF